MMILIGLWMMWITGFSRSLPQAGKPDHANRQDLLKSLNQSYFSGV
ncbi:hypothetical protein [Rhodobacter lacus]|uniref:Uncharacterized protein n=1 Tax=Rhodobacter lacus TaxID=1641972 RepID=A0ABW5A4K2_9RHOB